MPSTPPSSNRRKGALRCGFSTGTAAVAAARAALRGWLGGELPSVVGVRLAAGYFLPVVIADGGLAEGETWVSVIKDGGDDPDVTHKAEIRVHLRCVPREPVRIAAVGKAGGTEFCKDGGAPVPYPDICIIGGHGVGVVTKPGLPVPAGEPAINPGPRDMMIRNLLEEIERFSSAGGLAELRFHSTSPWIPPAAPHILVGCDPMSEDTRFPGADRQAWVMEVEIEVPEGERLARHTLNPRLGIMGGISILGTTGLVRPFSHEAYEETIQAELSVARSNGCESVVLSTGGKSEHYARQLFDTWPAEAFVQVADFFAFSVREARRMGCSAIVHSVFFGKAVKMAQGHEYTHAHKNRLDLGPLAALCRAKGCSGWMCSEIEKANTARQALDLLLDQQALDLVMAVAGQAVEASWRIAEGAMNIRLLLFNYDGRLLADVARK
jgi:cobalt-precorrin-5B (C1)-methyltransferase